MQVKVEAKAEIEPFYLFLDHRFAFCNFVLSALQNGAKSSLSYVRFEPAEYVWLIGLRVVYVIQLRHDDTHQLG